MGDHAFREEPADLAILVDANAIALVARATNRSRDNGILANGFSLMIALRTCSDTSRSVSRRLGFVEAFTDAFLKTRLLACLPDLSAS
jgi:hypothetical protein